MRAHYDLNRHIREMIKLGSKFHVVLRSSFNLSSLIPILSILGKPSFLPRYLLNAPLGNKRTLSGIYLMKDVKSLQSLSTFNSSSLSLLVTSLTSMWDDSSMKIDRYSLAPESSTFVVNSVKGMSASRSTISSSSSEILVKLCSVMSLSFLV